MRRAASPADSSFSGPEGSEGLRAAGVGAGGPALALAALALERFALTLSSTRHLAGSWMGSDPLGRPLASGEGRFARDQANAQVAPAMRALPLVPAITKGPKSAF